MRVRAGTPQRSRLRPGRRRLQGFIRPRRQFAVALQVDDSWQVFPFSIEPFSSDERFGIMSVEVGPVEVQLTGIAPSTQFGQTSVGLSVNLTGIAPSTQFGAATVVQGEPGPTEVQLTGIAPTVRFGDLSIDGGAGWHETTAAMIRTLFYERNFGVPVVWDNRPMCFEPNPPLWVRFSVLLGDELQVTSGSGAHYRHAGLATAQIFSRLSVGDLRSINLADRITSFFRGSLYPGLVFRDPSMNVIGRGGMWWQINVSLPFVAERYFERSA